MGDVKKEEVVDKITRWQLSCTFLVNGAQCHGQCPLNMKDCVKVTREVIDELVMEDMDNNKAKLTLKFSKISNILFSLPAWRDTDSFSWIICFLQKYFSAIEVYFFEPVSEDLGEMV